MFFVIIHPWDVPYFVKVETNLSISDFQHVPCLCHTLTKVLLTNGTQHFQAYI